MSKLLTIAFDLGGVIFSVDNNIFSDNYIETELTEGIYDLLMYLHKKPNIKLKFTALEYLNAFSNEGRKIFVFGDMLELGNASKDQHTEVGKKCSSLTVDIVYTIGDHTVITDSHISKNIVHKHFKTKNLLIETLKNTIQKKDKVLFKGSRGMRMDEIINKVFKL